MSPRSTVRGPRSGFLRPEVARLPGYSPGEQPSDPGWVKLNTNENPYPPSPRVLEALRAVGPDLRLYPHPDAEPLRGRIAAFLGLSPERVMVGNGSDELLSILVRGTVGSDGGLAIPTPTYTLYETLAASTGARLSQVPFAADWSLPEAFDRAASRARLVLLANPNSPSGTVVPAERVEVLARAVRGLVAVDEAYVDFAERGCRELLDRLPNVVLLRSFSKSFSLAGARIGALAGPADLVAGLRPLKDSYNVSRLAIAAGVAALEDLAWMRRNADRIRATRERLSAGLRALGFEVPPSQANFVLAIGRADARPIHEALKAKRILVRHFDSPRLRDALRITVGTDEETDRLLAELERIGRVGGGGAA
ncbi:MAG: histidinol-phosphate transaminase [Planctomycetales bacterium]|nr:histidinol-phosphate transaminase [Planctomycetales bacterium]